MSTKEQRQRAIDKRAEELSTLFPVLPESNHKQVRKNFDRLMDEKYEVRR